METIPPTGPDLPGRTPWPWQRSTRQQSADRQGTEDGYDGAKLEVHPFDMASWVHLPQEVSSHKLIDADPACRRAEVVFRYRLRTRVIMSALKGSQEAVE